MTHPKKQTIRWFVCGLFFSLMVMLIVVSGLYGKTWVADPEGIPETAEAILHNLRSGNWDSLQELVAGNPNISPDCGDDSSVERLIYQAYLESLDWTCQQECYVQDACVIQTITVKCLDIHRLTKAMADYLNVLPEDTILPENQGQLLYFAAEQLLEADMPVKQYSITLTFLREENRWRVIPNHAFLTLLSGFPSRQR